jgi:ABC-type uncharacterized transport system auxiliary subunit
MLHVPTPKAESSSGRASSTFGRPVVAVLFVILHRVIRNEFYHLRFVVKSIDISPQKTHKVLVAPRGENVKSLACHSLVLTPKNDHIVVYQHIVFDRLPNDCVDRLVELDDTQPAIEAW